MAKINLEFDTETKDLSVKIDGVDVPNVISVELYPGSLDGYDVDEYRCSITTQMMDEEKDINTFTRMSASAKGFTFNVRPTVEKIKADIKKYFGVK